MSVRKRQPFRSIEGAGVSQNGPRQLPRIPTIEEMRAKGFGRYIIDRSTHPHFYASLWPSAGMSTNTLGRSIRYRLPHLNYNSVLIAVISNQWQKGGWHRLQDMLRYTEEKGYTVALEEVDDMSIMPPDAIGIMRACAAMLALDSGFEWCLMMDTDALVEPDTLVRLLRHDRPIVYPLVIALQDKFEGGPLQSPRLQPDTGLQAVTWATMCCMLFNTKVFNCLDAYAWHGHDYHFSQNLAHFGHRILVDTDTVVNVTRGPARHPVKAWDELWSSLKQAYESRQNDDRDRTPPPDFDPACSKGYVDESGVYWGVESWKRLGVKGPMQHDQGESSSDGNKEGLDKS